MLSLRLLGRAARSRVVVFLVAGAALYGIAQVRADKKVVAIDPEVLAAMRDAQAKKLGVRELGDDGRREVDARAIEDELLYREAIRMGLDKEDPIVRQRLAQKLLLLVEDMGGASREPTNEELAAYFDRHRDRWRRAPRFHVVHVFASSRDRLPGAEVLAGATTPPVAGEPFPYPRTARSSQADLARVFGASFAAGVAALPAGAVSEPLPSSFGWHRVRLIEREEGGPARFEEVQKDVLFDFMLERREEVVGTYLKKVAASYEVRVGDRPLVGFTPTRRVAARVEGSAED